MSVLHALLPCQSCMLCCPMSALRALLPHVSVCVRKFATHSEISNCLTAGFALDLLIADRSKSG